MELAIAIDPFQVVYNSCLFSLQVLPEAKAGEAAKTKVDKVETKGEVPKMKNPGGSHQWPFRK